MKADVELQARLNLTISQVRNVQILKGSLNELPLKVSNYF